MSNDTIQQTKITGLSHDGRGIGRLDGKTLFISGALADEVVTFKYTRRHRRYDEATVIDVIEPAAERVTPKCPHYGVCGGCSLQHMAPAAQIATKQHILEQQLQHIGQVSPDHWLAPLTGPHWGYRHKARLGVRYVEKKQELLIGFREKHYSRFICRMDHCDVLHPSIGHNITALKQLLAGLSNKQHIPQLEIAVGEEATALIIRHLQAFTADDLQRLIHYGQQQNIHLYLQPNKISSIHRIWPTTGHELLSYSLKHYDLKLAFHPSDFTQVNNELNQRMVQQALELLEPQPHESVLDLFCGLGNFTLALAKQCRDVLGVEGSEAMVQRAQQNATLNQISNASFICGDLSDSPATSSWPRQQFAKLLLDPPRTGALAIVREIEQFAAQRIVYISCNPATLARDAGELVNNHSYRLTKAGVMDMFPHTSHVESIALFERT